MKKIAIIGHFGENKRFYDGQTVKTRIFAQELEKALGPNAVIRVDTYNWRKRPFRLLFNCFSSIRNAKNIMFLTDEGGVKIFPWLLLTLNIFFGRKLHYVVVGGWLVHFPEKHPLLSACLKQLDYVWVETHSMLTTLKDFGFQNLQILPNFKNLKPLSEDQLIYTHQEPYPFCTFSRVMKEKGIEDAVNAIKNINAFYGRAVCTLDIYGAIDSNQLDWFEQLSLTFTNEIKYHGAIPYDESVQVIKNYFALLFPTHYKTEGIPGTIIDAYAAGVPIIASRWNSFYDMIDEGITGIGYPCLHNEYLEGVIVEAIQSKHKFHSMKQQCLEKSTQYLPSYAISTLLKSCD